MIRNVPRTKIPDHRRRAAKRTWLEFWDNKSGYHVTGKIDILCASVDRAQNSLKNNLLQNTVQNTLKNMKSRKKIYN